MSGRLSFVGSLLLIVGIVGPGGASAAPPGDRVLPLDQYKSEKARSLARIHARALDDLNAEIYHCLPWVEVQKESVGFFKPKHVQKDDRYLSVRIYVEQDPSPQFAKLSMAERASAMFSRYVGPLLKRMTRSASVRADRVIDGFTVIVEWLKPPAAAGDRPIHETIAAFIPKSAAAEYLAGRAPIGALADWARVFGWDGETALGPLRVTAWDDNFMATYKVKNYEMEPGVTCP